MRILITGGAGFLGAGYALRALARGDEVLVVDTFATSDRTALPEDGGGLEVVEASVADGERMAALFARFRPDAVVHAAAAYKDPDDWIADAATNVAGTIHCLRTAEAVGTRRFVYLQTALCYGKPGAAPVREDAPLRPFTSYGISKTAGEAYALAAEGLETVSLRIANTTGPRLAVGPIPTFYARLKAGRACFCTDAVRDFLDLEDFFALLDAALEPGAPTGAFNASTGEGHAIREVYELVAAHLGVAPGEPEIRPPADDDAPVVVLDPSAAKAAFGWRPCVRFEASVTSALAWYDAHGVRAVYSHLRAGAPSAA
jgi:UDP-glucose 4-epimerase